MTKTEEILVVDDEPRIRKLLAINLEANGYRVLEAETGKQGIRLAAQHPPDLVLLDIQLPDMSGHEVLKEMRQWYSRSILMVTVVDEEADIVRALDNGATDYITKPFRSAELLARVRSALRRNQHAETGGAILQFGDLILDLAGHSVVKSGIPLKLTQTEFQLLALLARHPGRVLTQSFLLKEIWGVGRQTETQYLRVFIGSLRKKIEDDPARPRRILTESGIGYRFMG